MSAIEQNLEKLLAFTTFTFDLEDATFIAYFIARTGQVVTSAAAWKALVTNPPDDHWRITRAKLQNCWELLEQERGAAVDAVFALARSNPFPTGVARLATTDQLSLF